MSYVIPSSLMARSVVASIRHFDPPNRGRAKPQMPKFDQPRTAHDS